MNLNTDDPHAVRSIPNPSSGDRLRTTEIRDVMDAIRFVYTLTKQLPLPPLVAALVVSLTLGTIPAATTIVCSLIRELIHWCRDVGKSPSNLFDADGPDPAPVIADEPITANPFESHVEYMETL